MPVPSAWTDISDSASSNSPLGSENVGPNMNAYLQAAFAYSKQLYEGQWGPTNPVTINNQKLINLANGVNPTDAVNMSQIAGFLPIAGGTMTGALGVNAAINTTGILTITNSGQGALKVIGNNASLGANIQLFDGSTSTNKYIRCLSNNFQIINNAYSAVPFSMDDSGNLTMTGNVTAYSDERIKRDWASLPNDFIERLAKVKNGTYTRIDGGQRQVGVGAQSLMDLMPEAVSKDYRGTYAVAYGNAALAAVVELSKEIVSLRSRLRELEQKS